MIFFSSEKVGYVIVPKVGHMFFFLKMATSIRGIFLKEIPNVGNMFIWLVVSKILYFHAYLGKISNLTNIFQMG